MRQPLLHVSDVSKRFGDVVALDQVSLDIYEGDIIGLVGSNGAGKTTLLRLLAGVYRPSSGRVHLADDADVEQARARLGVVPENTGLYARLTAWENIRYHARIHGVPDDLAWKANTILCTSPANGRCLVAPYKGIFHAAENCVASRTCPCTRGLASR